jgi:hypothetical protein
VKWSNVAPKIQRHPRHDRVVARKIEVPRVRRCEESQGGLYRLAGVYGSIGGDEGRILNQRKASAMLIACIKKIFCAARRHTVGVAENSYFSLVKDVLTFKRGVHSLHPNAPGVVAVTIADADDESGSKKGDQQYRGQIYDNDAERSPTPLG